MTFIPNKDFYLSIAQGLVSGYETNRKFGASTNLSTTEQVISFNSGTTPYFPTTAQTLSITSNSANDTNTAGTGARKIVVEGLDANFDVQTETINLNGTTTVTSANTYIRLYRAYVSDCGTYGSSNVGNITITNGGANIFLVLEAGKGQSQTTKYTVPAGYTAYVYQVHLSVETSKQINFRFWKRENANDVTAGYSPKKIVQSYKGIADAVNWSYLEAPFKFDEYTDIWFTGQATSGTAEASVEYPFILIQN